MSTGSSLRFHVLWITLQILVFLYRYPCPTMANFQFTPYVSEFEYESRFHPSKNPDCAFGRFENFDDLEDAMNRRDFHSTRYKRSPEEEPPVGQEPSIEVRAILVRCPKSEEETDDILINRNIYNITAGRSQDILDFHGCDRDEPIRHSEVRDCRKKLVITMRFNNIGRTKTQEEFVVIDHVLDPVTMHKARLLNPFVIKVRQEPVLQLYGLNFQGVVNAEAREEVMNNRQSNYTGCDVTSENPTCGQMFFEEKPIPYSQGFCCSCDPDVNVQRQSSVFNETGPSSFPNIVSKSKERHIRPFKSVRSMKANFADDFSDLDGRNKLPSLEDINGNSLVSSRKASNFQQNFDPIGSDSVLEENPHEEERDLINLKKSSARNSAIWKSDKLANKNRVEAHDFLPDDPLSVISKFPNAVDEDPTNLTDAKRSRETSDEHSLRESQIKNEENLLKRKSSINILDELTKLEQDYKNFHRTSKLRDEGRRNRTNFNIKPDVERTTPKNEIYSHRSLNVADAENFHSIKRLGKKLFPKNDEDGGNSISTSTSKESIPVDETIYTRTSTTIRDVKPVFKSIINRVNALAPSWSIRSSDVLQSETTSTWTVSQGQTAAILWQKLARDRVYPLTERNNVHSGTKAIINTKSDRSTELTVSFTEKFGRNVADLLSNVVISNQLELPSYDHYQPDANQSIIQDKYNTRILEDSITTVDRNYVEITPILESTGTIDRHDSNGFTTSFYEPNSRAEISTDTSSSFSSGNHETNDAIVLSGSLKNQLENGLTYNERKQYEMRGGGKNWRENYDEKIEFGNKGEIEAEQVGTSTNDVTKKYDFNDDESNNIIANRKPVEMYLETRYDRGPSNGINGEEISSKIRSNIRNLSPGLSFEHLEPGKTDIMRKTKSERWNVPRSYRSIAENDRFVTGNNDRQRNIDKIIEDEFEEISDVLKDAGEGAKIIRQRPKSDETFERDDSVMKKFASLTENASKGAIKNTNLKNHQSKYDAAGNEKHRAIAKRFKQRKSNDASVRDSYRYLVPEKSLKGFQKFDRIVNNNPEVEPMPEEIRSQATDSGNTSEMVKRTEEYAEPVSEIEPTTDYKIAIDRFKLINNYKKMPGKYDQSTDFTNVPPKIRGVIEKEAASKYPDNPTVIKNEFPSKTISDIPVATEEKTSYKVLLNFRNSTDVAQKHAEKGWTNTSISHAPSPIFMIENLKKQLRKEAKSLAPFSQPQAARSNPRNVGGHWKYANRVRDVNTELTPAEKVEDLITDAETLPPDEETNYTTFSSEIARDILSSLTTPLSSEPTISNTTVSPRFAIRGDQKPYSSKEISDKVFLPLEESFPSYSASNDRLENGQKTKVHRRRFRRKKHLSKNKRNNASRSFIDDQSKRGDNDNTWHDTKIQKALRPSSMIPIASRSHETQRSAYDEKRSEVLENNRQNEHSVSNHDLKISNPEEMVLSMSSISGGDRNSSIEAPSIDNTLKSFEIDRKDLKKRVESNVPVNISTQMQSVDTNKQPIVPIGPMSSSNAADSEKVPETTKPEVITTRSWRNLQTLSSRKFPSFYPRSSDIIAMSENKNSAADTADGNGKNEKREDAFDVNENAKESVVFYDYEDEGRNIVDYGNSGGKRSLDNIVPEEMIGGIEPWEGWKDKMELLKLKKHADVLKEYLNWRHDVAPPEPQGIPGYTTKISMTIETSEEEDQGFSIATSLSETSTECTQSTVAEVSNPSIEEQTEDVTSKGSCEENDVTESTTIDSTVEFPSITEISCDASKMSDNPSSTEKVGTSADCFGINGNDDTNMTIGNVFYEEETSTGRILPPCDSKIGFSEIVDAFVATQPNVHTFIESATEASPTVISDHQSPSRDINNDLIVISILENSLLENENPPAIQGTENSPAKIHKIREEFKAPSDSRHRRHKTRKKNSSRSTYIRRKRMPARRLMSFRELNDDYDDEMSFVDSEENKYVDISNNMNTRNFGSDDDSSILQRKWNRVIEKIMHENSTELPDVENTTKSMSRDITDDNRSVLKQLHFYNADKYIKKIAKKIVHNSNNHGSKDLGDSELDKIEGPRQKAPLVGRKLKQYPEVKKFQLRSKMADRYPSSHDLSSSQRNSIHKKEIANVSSYTEKAENRKNGRDFAISLSGKVHVEGGTNGQPMSISFDTSPDVPKMNEALQSKTNETIKYVTETKVDAEKPPNRVLSSLFNIADVPKESGYGPLKDDKNSSSNLPLLQSIRSTRDDDTQLLMENQDREFPDIANKVPSNRKRRAIGRPNSKRYSKYRDERSYDLEDSPNSKIIEDSEGFPVSINEKEYNDNNRETGDVPAALADRVSSESEQRPSDNNGGKSLEGPDARMINVAPLNMAKSFSSLSSSESGRKSQQDTKKSRMIASHLPTMNDENVPGTTVRAGRIKPAELPWREHEYDTENDESPTENHFQSIISESHSPNSLEEDEASGPYGFTLDQSTSTSNPMNSKVMGLMSMGEPAMNEPINSNTNSDPNFKIAPLINVKIQQQPASKAGSGHNFVIPLDHASHEEGCPKIETTHPKNIADDNSLCSQSSDPCNKEEDEAITRQPHIPSWNMGSEEEHEEPTEIYSEPDYVQHDIFSPPAVTTTCADDQEIPRIPSTRSPLDKTDLRKTIRKKNMLAILEFMQKINKIMSVDDSTDLLTDDYNDAIIKLERVIIWPTSGSANIFKTNQRVETASPRVVNIGEGVTHNFPDDGENCEENDRSSQNRALNNQDQNFLFHEEDDHIDSPWGSHEYKSDIRHSSDLDGNNNEPIFEMKKHPWFDSSESNATDSVLGSSQDEESNTETMVVVYPEAGSRSEEGAVLRDSKRKIDDNFRDNEATDIGKTKEKIRYTSGNKRKAMDPDLLSFSKIKRHRSINRLPSYGNGYDFHDERRAGGQMDRIKASNNLLDPMSNEMLGRFAARNDIPREKRKRKKKKKKRRRKKKRKKKRKKGKNRTDMKKKPGWWPFKRQLMSLTGKQHVILDSNFDREVRRTKPRKRSSHRIPFTLQRRKIRKIHRTRNAQGKKKKMKKNRKSKKGKKKKNKKKTKKPKRVEATSARNKRQINPGGTQTRGGQDCMNRRHPSNVDPVKYLESTHCLRFSDLWYSVYELENPIMEHTVYLQLFEKHSLPDGTTHWDDLTQGTMVRMGTFTRHQRDDKPTIVFTYSGAKMEIQNRALNLDPPRQRLLVPSPVAPNKASQYSEVRGPGEYLVVNTNGISKNGKDCDKAGVDFTAFAKQDDRCGRAKGSCLKNQPLDYWRHDMEARNSGRSGCYFLSNFATVPANPIKYNVSGSDSREYLGLEYHSAHVSVVDIEVRTDYNAIVRVGSSGRVTEVYVDSTSQEHTVVTVVISNMGLASSSYQPRITDCPTGLPVSWTKAKGIMQVIPPQHDQRVTLDLYGQLLQNGFHCSVEVVNHRGELVAMRRIRIQKMDRCFCVWHCLCACIGSVSGLGCQPMSPEHYHAAGFQGPVPVISTDSSMFMNAVKDILMLSALIVLLLLLLGLLKWFVGIFAPSVGRWGLNSLLEGTRIDEYFESELRCRCVVTDDYGVPVHPDTGQRTVRLCSRKLEFILNVIFFLTYPTAMCCGYFKRSLQSSRQRGCCPDESKMCLIDETSSCPKLICVSTYGDSRNSKLEAEDTRYVMNELKRSQESLQNPKGTKNKNGRKSDKASSRKSSHRNKNTSDMTAKRLVAELLRKRSVFRNLTKPIGGLAVPFGTVYSLRGYFLNTENGGYRFITPCPFKQYWLIENNKKIALKPPKTYPSSRFMCSFDKVRDVYDSEEISLTPKGTCINAQCLDDS